MISYEYGLWAEGCYTDTQRGSEFYTETTYALLGAQHYEERCLAYDASFYIDLLCGLR